MAWDLVRTWTNLSNPHNSGTGTVSFSSGTPAATGSSLILEVATKIAGPSSNASITVSDNLGGVWSQVTDANGDPVVAGDGASSKVTMFARLGAGGVTNVTITSLDTSTSAQGYLIAFLREYTGGPAAGAVEWVVDSTVGADGNSWPVVGIDVPSGALVTGLASTGVTNRFFNVDLPWAYQDHRSSGLSLMSARLVTTQAETDIGPEWIKTSGSATSLPTLTAAIVGADSPDTLSVDVGIDRTINVGDSISLTANVSNGFGPRTFSWTKVSGPSAGQFVSPESATTAFDTGGVAGTYTLRCTVSDETGVAHDDMVLTVLSQLAFLPAVAITATGWTVIGPGGDPLVALSNSNDSDRVTIEDPVDAVIELIAPPLMVPDQDFQVRFRGRRRDGTSGNVVGRLYTGATLRATSSLVTLPVTSYDWGHVTFPLASLSGISSSNWQAGVRVTLTFNAS